MNPSEPKPLWDFPGLTEREREIWAAADAGSIRCSDAAPEIPRGSDVALALKAAYPNWTAFQREYQAEKRTAEKQAGETRAA